MKNPPALRNLLLFLSLSLVVSCAEFDARVPDILNMGTGTSAASLTYNDYVQGVIEALKVGIDRTVQNLGRSGGFLNDKRVRIPMPEELQRVESVLRNLGQDRYADEFVETMNRAAERAVPKASGIFYDAVKQMRIEDARRIVSGPDNAATEYFRDKTYEPLRQTFLPVVRHVTAEVGVTAAYKRMMDKAGPLRQFLNNESVDIDRYITRKALDGLFIKLADEENQIRHDPVARTSEILRKVFG
jgi:hypothetical protein